MIRPQLTTGRERPRVILVHLGLKVHLITVKGVIDHIPMEFCLSTVNRTGLDWKHDFNLVDLRTNKMCNKMITH